MSDIQYPRVSQIEIEKSSSIITSKLMKSYKCIFWCNIYYGNKTTSREVLEKGKYFSLILCSTFKKREHFSEILFSETLFSTFKKTKFSVSTNFLVVSVYRKINRKQTEDFEKG